MSDSKKTESNSIKNPFIPRRSTTVRRSREEVYPQGTDLSKPQFKGTTPLDLLFQDLEFLQDVNLNEESLQYLLEKLLKVPKLEQLSDNDRRYEVVKALFENLQKISELSLKTNTDHVHKDLISISLHDMKILSKIVNLIIILGVYPATSAFGIGIAIEKRRMGLQGKANKSLKVKSLQINSSPNGKKDYSFILRLLEMVYDQFTSVFSLHSDVRSLLLKGTGYSDYLVTTLALTTVPDFDPQVRSRYLSSLRDVTSIPSTFELYQIYSLLISSPCPPTFKSFVLLQLLSLPYAAVNGDGVLSLIEFVLGLREEEEISMAKLDQVSEILLLKPKHISTKDYFTNIGSQCFNLLVNINRPVINSAVTHFMNRLWLKNARVLEDFFFARIRIYFSPSLETDGLVLVSEAQLNNAINVLLSISKLGISKDALYSLISPIWLEFWCYYVFCKLHKRPCNVFEDILISFLESLSDDGDYAYILLETTAKNLLYDNLRKHQYRTGPNQLVEIARTDEVLNIEPSEKKILEFMNSLGERVEFFAKILKRINFSLTQKLFMALLSKWASKGAQTLEGNENPFIRLIDLKILEKIAVDFKDKLGETPYASLKLLYSILSGKETLVTIKGETHDEVDSDDEDDMIPMESKNSGDSGLKSQGELYYVALELLTTILQEMSNKQIDDKTIDLLKKLRTNLESSESKPSSLAIITLISKLLEGERLEFDGVDDQRQKLNKALADINDSLVPVRAQGLSILKELIEQESKVISIDFVVKTHISQLGDSDPFIYLNAIKGLESLLNTHNEAVLKNLLKAYSGHDKEFSTIDDRLKLGEALGRYVQKQGLAFGGSSAQYLVKALLEMVRVPSSGQPIDDRLRMSAMSLLGTCFKTNVLGVVSEIREALDCALGILQLELTEDKAIMRRSALVLIHDLLMGTSMTANVPFPTEFQERVFNTVSNVKDNDEDILTKEQAASVLQTIEDLVEAAFTIEI